jgi:23S rRNA pseudouridine1911/1915/1917 synthase
MKLEVLYEDNHLLAVLKPAGLLVQGDRSGDATLLDAAGAYLKEKYDKPGKVYLGLVHRLDRNVSGVVLLARTSKAAGRLAAQFRDKTVTKIYRAVVAGCPPTGGGELIGWLGAKGDACGVTRAEKSSFPEARESLLRYRVLASQGDWSHVEVQPVTGRRHQIRAQFALEGYPLLGDRKYGSRRRWTDQRIALHALRLTVLHPVGAEPLVLEAALPKDWPWPVITSKEITS